MKKFIFLSLLLAPCFFLLTGFQEQKTELTREDQLKKLNWLVGQWVDKDKDDDVELNLNYAWEDNNNFLVNTFTIEDKDKKTFSGKQIITWDQANKKFRSWLFDSNGAFGQGEWKQKGDKWIAEYAFILPNGDNGSAIHIYKSVNPDSYTFQSVGRMIQGELLPDIAEVTVVRKK